MRTAKLDSHSLTHTPDGKPPTSCQVLTIDRVLSFFSFEVFLDSVVKSSAEAPAVQSLETSRSNDFAEPAPTPITHHSHCLLVTRLYDLISGLWRPEACVFQTSQTADRALAGSSRERSEGGCRCLPERLLEKTHLDFISGNESSGKATRQHRFRRSSK